MSKVIIIGCDPGIDGGLAMLDGDGQIAWTSHLPAVEVKKNSSKKELIYAELWRIIDERVKVCEVVFGVKPIFILEKVQSMPTDGAVQAFKFGTIAGSIRMAMTATGCRVERYAPVQWKRALGLNNNKDASVVRACEFWPTASHLFRRESKRAKTGYVNMDGIAEAALIGYYGRRILFGFPKEKRA